MILKIFFFQIRQLIEINLNNPKGTSFKETHLITTTRDAMRTTSNFRVRSLTDKLNFLSQSKHA